MAAIPTYIDRPIHQKESVPLELRDYTRKPRTARPSRRNIWESLFFAAALAALFAFCLVSTVRTISNSFSSASALPAPAVTLPVIVRPGDTLWSYAQRYGNSQTYILNRMEAIARFNHLPYGEAIVPGEHLNIPVTNPIIIAKINRRQRIADRTGDKYFSN